EAEVVSFLGADGELDAGRLAGRRSVASAHHGHAEASDLVARPGDLARATHVSDGSMSVHGSLDARDVEDERLDLIRAQARGRAVDVDLAERVDREAVLALAQRGVARAEDGLGDGVGVAVVEEVRLP